MSEENVTLPEAEPKPLCPNCGKKMARKGKFCPGCGQRRFDGHFRMSELYERFVRQAFHLDNKILKMIWHLLLPAKVSIAFFNGQIKRYPNPVQFFFVVMFFFILLYNHADRNKKDGPVKIQTGSGSTINAAGDTSVDIKLSGNELYQVLERYARGVEMQRRFDSLPENLRTPEARHVLDTLILMGNPEFFTLLNLQNEATGDSTDTGPMDGLDSLPLSLLTQQVRVSTVDLMRLSPDALADKYQVHQWMSRLLLKQGVKAMKDPEGLRRTYLGSFTWTILVLIATMSLVLLGLFKKYRPYYAEHFVFLLHQHSGAFLVLTLALAVHLLLPLPDAVWWFFLLGIWIFLLFAFRRFYSQSWSWTVFKWFIYSGIYAIGFGVFFFIGLIVVLLLF